MSVASLGKRERPVCWDILPCAKRVAFDLDGKKKYFDRKPLEITKFKWSLNINNDVIPCSPKLNYYLEFFFRKKKNIHFVLDSENHNLSDNCAHIFFDREKNLHHTFWIVVNGQQKIFELERTVIVAGMQIDYPLSWNPNKQRYTCQVAKIKPDSEEFLYIHAKLCETLRNVIIEKIERVQNLLLLQKFQMEKRYVESLNENRNSVKYLFHGSRYVDPHTIYSAFGFDVRLGNKTSLWGKGAYFAEDAEYANVFSYRNKNNPEIRQLIFAKVIVDETFNFGTYQNNSLANAPFKIPYTNPEPLLMYQHYNSVSGLTTIPQIVGQYNENKKLYRVYTVYGLDKAYPEYIISYRICENEKLGSENIILSNTYQIDDNSIEN